MSSLLSKLPPSFQVESEVPGTSNVAGWSIPFQRWFHFKEAFLPSFVEEVIASTPHRVRTCLDPFGGCGTTSLTCQFLGVRPTTIEVNPFLADLIEAKLASYDIESLKADRLRIHDRCQVTDLLAEAPAVAFSGAPATFVEPGEGGRWIFDSDIAYRIQRYVEAISSLESEVNRRLFRVLLASVLVPVSNVRISGKGRRYRGSWKSRERSPDEVDALFGSAFQDALYDLCRFAKRSCANYTVLRGDCRVRISDAEPADLVLFSPPYPNSFDYTDIYNVELWALGYLRNGADNRDLRESTLRSHVQIKRTFADGDLGSPLLGDTLEKLTAARGDLWNQNIPSMVAAYFEDIAEVLQRAREGLSERAHIVMVVGDSSYADVLVDVPGIVCELLPHLGLLCEEVRAVRSMRNSPQHGGQFALSESMIRLAPA